MGLRSAFKTDPAAAQSGVWLDIPHAKNADGTIPGFLLARFGLANPKYQKAFQQFVTETPDDVENWTDEQDRERSNRFFVEFAVLNWRNVQPNDDGQSVTFSKDVAVEMLNAWEWVDLLSYLKTRAAAAELFKAKEADEIAKK